MVKICAQENMFKQPGKYEPQHDKTNKITYAPSELRSASASAQSDQILCCPHEKTSCP